MHRDIVIAVIGVLGTLLGTLLGWFLNNLSQRGKLILFLSFKSKFYDDDGEGGFKESLSHAKYYSYNADLEIYNSSSEYKVMRDVYISFCCKDKELFKERAYANSTYKDNGQYLPASIDEFKSVSIPPKQILTIGTHGSISAKSEEYNKLKDVDKLVLTYRNGKNKLKKIKIADVDYVHYFDDKKENQNGQA